MPNFSKGGRRDDKDSSRRSSSGSPGRRSPAPPPRREAPKAAPKYLGRGREESKKTLREFDDDEDRSSKSKKGTKRGEGGSKEATTGYGWEKAANKKAQQDSFSKKLPSFFLRTGESALVQFLSDDPYCVDGHQTVDRYRKFQFVPCQLTVQKHCLMCSDKSSVSKLSWRAAFWIVDYRGKWVADDDDFDGEPYAKVWMVSQTLANQIKLLADKKGVPLTELVFEISRSGKGKSTTYNFEIAFDDDDRKMKPIRYDDSDLMPLEEYLVPPTDDELEARGFEEPDGYDD